MISSTFSVLTREKLKVSLGSGWRVLLVVCLASTPIGFTFAEPVSIVDLEREEDNVVLDLQLDASEFNWHGTEFISVEAFPNPWIPDGPGLRHKLSLGMFEEGVAEWLQDDFIVVGSYEIVDSTRLLLTFEGFLEEPYDLVIDPSTGRVTLAGLDYLAHLTVPNVQLEHSSDLESWKMAEGVELPVGERVAWGELFSARVVGAETSGFFRVRGVVSSSVD